MEIIKTQSIDVPLSHLLNSLSLPETTYHAPPNSRGHHALIKAIIRDDNTDLINHSLSLPQPLDRTAVSKLLHLSCEFDSVNAASSLINGEVCGVVPLINEIDASSGYSPLHTAAQNHSLRCIELLLRKRARTELKTKTTKSGNGSGSGGDGNGNGGGGAGMLALELALRCSRMEVDWGPDEPLDELLLLLSEKDLTAIRLLAEKTKEVGEVAYKIAMEGQLTLLTALLMVAADRVNGSVLELRTDADLAAEKTTVFNCVTREAISIFSRMKQMSGKVTEEEDNVGRLERRKLLIREMELLHFFGASPNFVCKDKKVIPPLILASQAGDEAVMKVLLKTDIHVNESDVEGNSALHWCLKACKTSTPEQSRILRLLLNHGARVKQRNMLGLTAVHIASGNGNLEALDILLEEDPDSVYVTSELKETPLFLAAKNDFIECAQLLMRNGATTDVHNLRRERPIDLAKSQDMRTALNRTSVIITNRTSLQKYTARTENDEVISETCEMLLKEAYRTSESVGSSPDTEVCKYYTSSTGCVRGSKCFYKHGEQELGKPKSKSKVGFVRSTVLAEFKRRVFVGGLPPTLDSESLRCAIEEKFGPVVDAKVLVMEYGGEVVSRGFGFVTFKDEKSVALALEAHYTNIWGKKVEIKTVIPRSLLHLEDLSDEQQQRTLEKENTQQIQSQVSSPSEKSTVDDTTERMSWADRVAQSLPPQPVSEPMPRMRKSTGHNGKSAWFNTFKKWLPQFLRKRSANSKEDDFYSLSSLKTDFKAIFGLELDHASLGYSKLSDFVKSFPELCTVKFIHTGGQVANHMILLPNLSHPPPPAVSKRDACVPLPATPTHQQSDESSDSQKSHEDTPSCSESISPIRKEFEFETIADVTTDVKKVQEYIDSRTNPNFSANVLPGHHRFLQFLEPDPTFLGRTWLGTGGFKVPDPICRPKHVVLEALARKRKEKFYLRSLKFFDDYASSLKFGNCFACQKNKIQCANYPCQHLMWCGDCKLIASKVAALDTGSHKCVICDRVVKRFISIAETRTQQQTPDDMEFPPIHAVNPSSHMLLA